MSNEIVKKDNSDSMLTIGPGPISLEGLDPSDQNELRMLAAKKGIDLAADAAQGLCAGGCPGFPGGTHSESFRPADQ